MRISGIIWLEPIAAKLWDKHGVREHEVAEVLEGKPLFRRVEKGHRPGEDVYSALGRTDAGRYLVVIFIWKGDRRALVVSAREMTDRERRQYGRR